jgi:lipopolysaccharide export system permease protein
MFGEKFVRQGLLNPLGGTWLPVFALSPVGIFLTYKASMDSQLFSKEYYYRFFKKMLAYVEAFLSKFRGRN